MMISVESIMTPDPISLSPDDTLGTAHQLMNEKHIHHIPIIDKNNEVVGLISHRDVLAASGSTLKKHPSDNSDTLLSEIMASPVVSIPPSAGTLKAAQYIHNSRHGCLPIIDENGLIGIVTEYDFVEVAINLLERRDTKPFEGNQADDDDYQMDNTPEDLGIDVSDARDWD
jgi:CBS domain-containing protein